MKGRQTIGTNEQEEEKQAPDETIPQPAKSDARQQDYAGADNPQRLIIVELGPGRTEEGGGRG